MPQMIRNFHSMVISFGVYEVPLAVALISVQLGFVRETVEVFISFCLTEIFIEIKSGVGCPLLKDNEMAHRLQANVWFGFSLDQTTNEV